MSDLADLLLKSGDLEFDQLESIRGQQQYHGGRLEHLLVESRMITENTLVAAICRVTELPPANLDAVKADGIAMARLPEAFCWELPCFPVAYDEGARTVTVAVTDPTDLALLDRLIHQSGCRVKALVGGVQEIRRAIRRHYRGEYIPEGNIDSDPSMGEAAGDEFKITDMSGNTLMTSMEQLREQHEAQLAARGHELPGPPIGEAPAFGTGGGSLGSAGTNIDDLFEIRALSPAEMERLERVNANVEKSGIILGAILELLEEKGILSRSEISHRAG